MDFSSHGGELASLEVPDRPRRFTTEQGVKVEWPEFVIGEERIKYFIAGKPKQDLVLPFFTIWRTTDVPSAQDRLHAGNERRQGDRRPPRPRCPTARRRSTKKPKN